MAKENMTDLTATFALAIPHTPWRPERAQSLSRLVDCLAPMPSFVAAHRLMSERSANHEWSGHMWAWGAAQPATHFLTLQDDAIVPSFFWGALRAMVAAVPDQIIGLEAAHPVTPALAAEGEHWCTTSDGLIGVGYVVPLEVLKAFRVWRAERLKPGALEAIGEDTLLGLFCLATGRKIWHPIPTVIDHDVSVESTYGNDAHAHRRPRVTWLDFQRMGIGAETLATGGFWSVTSGAPHLGRFYDASPKLCRQWVKDFSQADYARVARDDGSAVLHALGRARARRLPDPKHRIMVAMPTVGAVSPFTLATIAHLTHAQDIEVDVRFAFDWLRFRAADVVRARSVLVRIFLEESQATHLFFVDSDVSFDPKLLAGMLRADLDFVAAPYPRREGIDFEGVQAVAKGLGEAAAYRYAIHVAPEGLHVAPNGIGEVLHMPLGCALMKREMLEKMVAAYAETLSFADRTLGPDATMTTVALFQLLLEDGELWGEDFSFCERWRRLGGKVYGYFGPGSPATHHGEHAFRGRPEAFGLRHT